MSEDIFEGLSKPTTRRDALRLGLITAGGVMLPSVLAACGTDGGGSGKTAAKAGVKKGGLAPFDPDAPSGEVPELPKAIAFPNPFDAALFLTVSKFIRQAAEERGLKYLTAISDGDPAKMVQQSESFFARGLGGLFLTPVNVEATAPLAQRAIDEGIVSIGVQRPLAHLQISENQYEIGKLQAEAAVKWIKQNANGEAKVAYFNEDNSEPIIPRHTAVLDVFKKAGPGIEVVSDLEAKLTTEAGASAMSTVLQAHPDVNVVLGGSGAIQGAYAAFDAAGKGNEPGIYLSSVAGDTDAFDMIRTGTSSYKATTGTSWPVWAYAVGQFAADWLEGKSIPKGMSTATGGQVILDSKGLVDGFAKDMADPKAVWNDSAKRAEYVSLYGNINYETRNTYLKDVWEP